MKQNLTKYGITTAVGLLLAFLFLNSHGFFEMTQTNDRYRCLCDAFTVPGVIIVMCGCLVWIAQQGTFDTISYAGKMIADRFRPDAEHLRYGDYVLAKMENRKKGGFGFLFITGAGLLVIAAVFYVLFYMNY